MKFFITFALIVAVASARVVKPMSDELHDIIAAIHSPSTNPATAVALESMLLEAWGAAAIAPPVAVGPAMVDAFEPISVGPAMIDFPLPETAIATPVQPSPVAVGPSTIVSDSQGAPLVQIILNINQAAAEATPVAVSPVAVAPEAIVDDVLPVIVVDEAAEPINIVDFAPEQVIVPSPVIVAPEIIAPSPVIVVPEVIAPTPVIVVDQAPIAVEPVIIGTPIIPSPAINLPDTLN